MAIKDEIAILDLLRQREAEFVKVWQCEDGICRLLGLTAFPFAGAPALPSRQKGKRTVSLKTLRRKGGVVSSKGAETSGAPGAPQLRKLSAGEDAYRVVYRHNDREEASFQLDADVLRKLFLLESDEFSVLSVETVSFRSLEDWTSLDVLWARGVPGSKAPADAAAEKAAAENG